MKCALTAALGMTFCLTSSEANANGRFPRGEHILEYPSDSNRILLAATYGLVTTKDGGKNWTYVCETAFSLYPPPMGADPGYTGDPLLALTAGESLLAGVQTRITKSNDQACGWAKSYEDPNTGVLDLAVAPSNRNIAVALTQPKGGGALQVYETTDGGTTWGPIGTAITSIVVGHTIDVDPKDPNHLMVTGLTTFDPVPQSGVFVNSTNHGMTWTISPIPNTNIDSIPYIAGVHPTDGTKVFVRTDAWIDDGVGATLARDTLYYSKDSGQTWTAVLQPTGVDGNGAKLYGFAISPNGETVLAGFGDPVEGGGRNVDRDVMGVYKSTGADYAFGAMPKPVFQESATCITWTAKGIYVCGSPQGMTSYISFASDVNNVTAAGLKKIMDVSALKGEPDCCSGRAVTACDWNVDCTRFEACGDSGMPPPALPPDAAACMMADAGSREGGAGAGGGVPEGGADGDVSGSGGTGSGGRSGAAGTAGSGDGSSTGGAGGSGRGGAGTGGAGTGGAGTGGAGTGGTGGGDDGCNCRVATAARSQRLTGLGLLLGLVGASGWRRSRRRQKIAA